MGTYTQRELKSNQGCGFAKSVRRGNAKRQELKINVRGKNDGDFLEFKRGKAIREDFWVKGYKNAMRSIYQRSQ